MTKALLDYDGFICKAFYACIARDENDFDTMLELMEDLTQAAIDKVKGLEKVHKVISGHSWKKDIYPSYKSSRKRNEDLGAFREYVKFRLGDELLCVPQLEADELLVMLYYQDPCDSIVFSDDKDLRYYCPAYCKINITEELEYETEYEHLHLAQLLAGDSEDSITGIPKVGMKTADKLLSVGGEYNIKGVIKIYKEKGIELDECIKNLILTIPMYPEYIYDYKFGLSDSETMNNILGQCRYISTLVKEIYDDRN